MGLEAADEFNQHRSFKRRRFNMDVSMDGDSENSVNHVSFPMHHTQQPHKSPFATSPHQGEFRHGRLPGILRLDRIASL